MRGRCSVVCTEKEIRAEGKIRFHIVAVSYTHLDVYKRQVCGRGDTGRNVRVKYRNGQEFNGF